MRQGQRPFPAGSSRPAGPSRAAGPSRPVVPPALQVSTASNVHPAPAPAPACTCLHWSLWFWVHLNSTVSGCFQYATCGPTNWHGLSSEDHHMLSIQYHHSKYHHKGIMHYIACVAEASCAMVVFSASHLAESRGCIQTRTGQQQSGACIAAGKLAAWNCVMAQCSNSSTCFASFTVLVQLACDQVRDIEILSMGQTHINMAACASFAPWTTPQAGLVRCLMCRPAKPNNGHSVLQGNDPESQAWAAFDASRRAQMGTAGRAQRNTMVSAAGPSQARAASHSPEPIAPASPVLQRYTKPSTLLCSVLACCQLH